MDISQITKLTQLACLTTEKATAGTQMVVLVRPTCSSRAEGRKVAEHDWCGQGDLSFRENHFYNAFFENNVTVAFDLIFFF